MEYKELLKITKKVMHKNEGHEITFFKNLLDNCSQIRAELEAFNKAEEWVANGVTNVKENDKIRGKINKQKEILLNNYIKNVQLIEGLADKNE